MSPFQFARMVLALTLIAAPGLAVRAAELDGVWRCVRTDSRGYIHECEMRLAVDSANRVTGRIDWTLLRSPQPDDRAKLGQKGVEYIRGRVTSTESLFFEGHAEDDPHDITGLDIYPLQVSPGGKWMFGRTETGGNWSGQFYATPLDATSTGPTSADTASQ